MTSISVAVLVVLCFIGGFTVVSQAWPLVARFFPSRGETGQRHGGEDTDEYSRRVLGTYPGADLTALRAAYESRMAKYDPAKFDEYGPEFKALAEERRKVIIAAYDHLMRRAT
jgi:hypothetical protein